MKTERLFLKTDMAIFAALIFAAMVIFSGCSQSAEGRLRHIDIVGAQSLMIAPQGSMLNTQRSAAFTPFNVGANVLLRQNEDGTWVQARMTDEDGREMQMEPPSVIVNATDDWVIMQFRPEVYLVNRFTGYVYDITSVGRPCDFWTAFSSPVYVDRNGNIYYIPIRTVWEDRRIVKISLGSTHGAATMITPADFMVEFFSVDYDGNILFSLQTHFMTRTFGGNMISLHTHPIAVNLISQDIGTTSRIFGIDGNIYVFPQRTDMWTWNPENIEFNIMYRVEINGSTVNDVNFIPVIIDGTTQDASTLQFRHMLNLPEKTIIFVSGREGAFGIGGIIILPKNDGASSIIPIHGDNASSSWRYSSEVAMKANGDVIFLYENLVTTINPETGFSNTRTLTDPDFLEIRALSVLDGDIIVADVLTFLGERVLVYFFPDDSIEIVSRSIPTDASITLTRLR